MVWGGHPRPQPDPVAGPCAAAEKPDDGVRRGPGSRPTALWQSPQRSPLPQRSPGFDFVFCSLSASASPKKQNLWLLETNDLAYPNTEAKNRPAQPSFFPHQTGRAQSVALR
jgi:hypothetical protein